MKANEMKLRVVNEVKEGEYEFIEFSPCMEYEGLVGLITEEAEILRFTGVKDKNGNEIYEGDYLEVVAYDEVVEPLLVKWNEGGDCWGLWYRYFEYDLYEVSECLIIGNKYQGIRRYTREA